MHLVYEWSIVTPVALITGETEPMNEGNQIKRTLLLRVIDEPGVLESVARTFRVKRVNMDTVSVDRIPDGDPSSDVDEARSEIVIWFEADEKTFDHIIITIENKILQVLSVVRIIDDKIQAETPPCQKWDEVLKNKTQNNSGRHKYE